MNMHNSLILKVMRYKFEQSHNALEATRNVCQARGEGTSKYSNQMIQEISLGLQEPQQLGWP